MLILSRKQGQRIIIGRQVTLTIVECRSGSVRIGFEAPERIEIIREELDPDFVPSKPPERNGAKTAGRLRKGVGKHHSNQRVAATNRATE